MKISRSCRLVLLCLAIVSAQRARAEGLPSYRQLDSDPRLPLRLRTEPITLSRFPTTFCGAFSAGGQQLRTVDVNGRVWQWAAEPSTKPELVADTQSEPSCAVLSDDGRLLAFAEPDGSVALFDLDAREPLFRDRGQAARTVTLRFSSDSESFAGASVDGSLRVWDVRTGKVVRELATAPGPVQTLAFSRDGRKLASGSFGQEVSIHDLTSVRPASPQVIRLERARLTALAFSGTGEQLVVAAADGTASVHDLKNGGEPILLAAHPFAIWSVAFDRAGQRMATGSWDGTIKLWDSTTWVELQSVKTHEESVAAMVFDADGGLVSAGLDGRLLRWLPDVESIASVGMLAGRSGAVWVTVYSPDGKRLFVGGREKRFEIWDMESKQLLVSRDGHATTRCAAFSPDGKILVTGGDEGRIYVRDSETGNVQSPEWHHPGAVSAVVFAAGGKTLVSVCDGGVVKVWDVATGEETGSWREHNQQIYCASISPDGRWLITGGGNWTTGDPGELIVWELETGRVRAHVAGHQLAVWNIVFTPDGERFAASDSSGAVRVWNLDALEQERVLQHETWVRPLAMAPDGRTLAVGRGDGSVRLWDTETWTQKGSCNGHGSFTFWLQYAPDGGTLVSAGDDGTARFWQTAR